MPVGSLPSSTGGVTTGETFAYCVVLQSPAAAPHVLANVHGGVLVFLIVVLPPPERDDGGIAGLGQLDAFEGKGADRGGAFLQD